ncbi:helix-turn-helix transcriptional regulator [Natrialbaceae archaeon AArc-T1-2]|uniref:helix-turn-helix transcriptional regulator n=1 Tax=Natrialbaceae archaeon AArc-T1-2 TaxID=3053904 RepID=UPI00255B3534|nr:hypothetical protein [Natrialbaceae archaeon AArc-T1-2]WIV68419.1 hypothetical protein QQ977_06775 [Natrialbaceae archaeon AArc-T1-2]
MDERGLGVLLCCLVVLGGLLAAAPAIAADERGANTPNAIFQTEDEPSLEGYDDLEYRIELHENGSASWTVEYQYRLDDDNDTVDWERLEADVNENREAYLAAFEERWDETLTEAENETDREMQATDFSLETDESAAAHEYGYVRFTFEWDSFAHVEVNRIEAGDALVGFELDERIKLDVSWPEAYNDSAIEPQPDDRRETAAIWDGEETDFREDEPRVEVIETGGAPVESPDESESLVSLPLLAAIGVAVVALIGAAGWLVTRNGRTEIDAETSSSDDPDATDATPPPELLSNEERVLRLLEQHGGRIKQQDVVSELEWTEAKTSQVVGELREAGEIDVFRIGRENVLTLPDNEVTVPDDEE